MWFGVMGEKKSLRKVRETVGPRRGRPFVKWKEGEGVADKDGVRYN